MRTTILTLAIALMFFLLLAAASPAFAQDAAPAPAVAAEVDAGADIVLIDTAPAVKPPEHGAITDWTLWVRNSALGKLAAGALLSVLVLAINKARGFVTDRAGALQVAVLALIGGVLSSIVSGAPIDPKLVEAVLTVGLSAIGGYSFVKKIMYPSDTPTKPSAPADPNTIAGEISRMPLPPPPEH
jgi:hypothetical protein